MTTFYVDAYNVIHACEPLKSTARKSMDAARGTLTSILAEYCAVTDNEVVLVFDGAADPSTMTEHAGRAGNFQIVYCDGKLPADTYIERAVFETEKRLDLAVVTRDRAMVQVARGMGAVALKPQSFMSEVQSTLSESRAKRRKTMKHPPGAALADRLSSEVLAGLRALRADVASQKRSRSAKRPAGKTSAGPETGT